MAARARGGGSIVALDRKKDGTKLPNSKCSHWRLKVSTGVVGHYPDGRRKYGQVTKRFTGTYRQAEDALAILREEVNAGRAVKRSALLFSEWLDHYHETRKASGAVKESTLKKNESDIKALKSAFGPIRLSDVDAVAIERAAADLASGKATGRKLSVLTSNSIMAYATSALRKAAKDGLFDLSQLSLVEKAKAGKPRKRSLTEEEFIVLNESLGPEDGREVAVSIVLNCGLRAAEVLGLRWCDIRKDGIHVSRQASRDGSFVEWTKTDAGFRTVPVPSGTMRLVEAWKARQQRLFEGAVPWSESTQVASTDGRTMRYNNFEKWWRRRRKELGVDYGLHELRHTFATMLAASSVSPAIVKSLMGHASSSMAIDVYTHANVTQQAVAIERMQEYIKGFSKG